MHVLDVGCGPGLYAEELLARGARRVVGVDASGEMVHLARRRVAGPVEFHRHDVQRPMSWLTDAEFDLAVMPLVIHHLDDRVAALREIARVRRPAGRLLLSTHHPTGDWVDHGGSYFTVEKIQERWQRGWQVTYRRQPLEASCEEFATAGFLIERVHEPQPSAELSERSPADADRPSITTGFIVFFLLNDRQTGSRSSRQHPDPSVGHVVNGADDGPPPALRRMRSPDHGLCGGGRRGCYAVVQTRHARPMTLRECP